MTFATTRAAVELGDFQTPPALARAVCDLLVARRVLPAAVVEPSCGKGTFMRAARNAFPSAAIHGFERNPAYVRDARLRMSDDERMTVSVADFFQVDWPAKLASLPEPLLILGNPPWVTNATIGAAGGGNLPGKSNVDRLRGIDAVTGQANFDISESMIREYFRWLQGRRGVIAVLCKRSVARRTLAHAWTAGLAVSRAAIHAIDAKRHFNAAVDACLLHVEFGSHRGRSACAVYDELGASAPATSFGMADGRLVADPGTYERWRSLAAPNPKGWRSGIKHDCGRVFEFALDSGHWSNGLGDRVDIEPEVVFPLLKSADLAHARPPRKRVLVPHRTMRESPERLRHAAPRAWRYLRSHRAAIERRASSIYKGRPAFSIFGIGAYAFAPWKVAISGFYKQLDFAMVGPLGGQPVLLDDTCYFFPCRDEAECAALHGLVSSAPAQEFYAAQIFWDAKRPITAKLLNLLDLGRLAEQLGRSDAAAWRLAGAVDGGWRPRTLFDDGPETRQSAYPG